ncbi:MAG: PP2C family serine/threonine-protein phosphatase [Calditrichia bacterium]
MASSKKITFKILEQFIQPKTGDMKNCEDRVHISENYVAVIDGTTSRTNRKWRRETGGQLVARVIDESLHLLNSKANAFEAVEFITSRVDDAFKNVGLTEAIASGKVETPSASFCALSLSRRELWSVGDCRYRIGGNIYMPEKYLDTLLAEVRALRLEIALKDGATIEELREKDSGRRFILPLLKKMSMFSNRKVEPYGYPVINGLPVLEQDIHIRNVPKKTKSIILASDGYPALKKSLKKAEAHLQKLLARDPLLFRDLKSTKGVIKGNLSFDDRSWIKIRLR